MRCHTTWITIVGNNKLSIENLQFANFSFKKSLNDIVFVRSDYVKTVSDVIKHKQKGRKEPGWRSRYSDSLRAGNRIPEGARYSALIQTGSEAHPAFCKMSTGSFPGVKAAGAYTSNLSKTSSRPIIGCNLHCTLQKARSSIFDQYCPSIHVPQSITDNIKWRTCIWVESLSNEMFKQLARYLRTNTGRINYRPQEALFFLNMRLVR